MSLKNSRIVAIVGTVFLSFLFHFAYNLFPNFIFSIIFPVNESVWEHMKILYSSILFYGIIDYFVGKKFNIKYNDFLFNLFFISFSSIIIYLAMFLPIYYSIGESMFISITLMVVTYIIVYTISYYILEMDNKNYWYIWVIFIVFGYAVFGYLTYNPLKTHLFFDTKDEIYGIKKRN